MYRALLYVVSLTVIFSCSEKPKQQTPLEYVDPMIGTTKLGNTYPAVCTPFGLTKWTPQTRAGEKKGDGQGYNV
jgi:putative alpha-1,2-mannosidase